MSVIILYTKCVQLVYKLKWYTFCIQNYDQHRDLHLRDIHLRMFWSGFDLSDFDLVRFTWPFFLVSSQENNTPTNSLKEYFRKYRQRRIKGNEIPSQRYSLPNISRSGKFTSECPRVRDWKVSIQGIAKF